MAVGNCRMSSRLLACSRQMICRTRSEYVWQITANELLSQHIRKKFTQFVTLLAHLSKYAFFRNTFAQLLYELKVLSYLLLTTHIVWFALNFFKICKWTRFNYIIIIYCINNVFYRHKINIIKKRRKINNFRVKSTITLRVSTCQFMVSGLHYKTTWGSFV